MEKKKVTFALAYPRGEALRETYICTGKTELTDGQQVTCALLCSGCGCGCVLAVALAVN